jgi:hypothetical protein
MTHAKPAVLWLLASQAIPAAFALIWHLCH